MSHSYYLISILAMILASSSFQPKKKDRSTSFLAKRSSKVHEARNKVPSVAVRLDQAEKTSKTFQKVPLVAKSKFKVSSRLNPSRGVFDFSQSNLEEAGIQTGPVTPKKIDDKVSLK